MEFFIFSILTCVFASASSASIRYPRQTWQEPFAVQFQVPSRGFSQQDDFNVIFDYRDGNNFEYPDYGQDWATGSVDNRPFGNWPGNNRPGSNRPNGNNRPGGNRPNGNNRPWDNWPNVNNRPNNNAGPGNRPNGNMKPGNNRPDGNAGPGNNRPNGNAGPGNNRPNGNARPGNNRPQITSPATTSSSSTTESASTPRTFHLTPEGCDCPFTPQFNPVCGTDGNTYKNSGLLRCFQRCGTDVDQRRMGAC